MKLTSKLIGVSLLTAVTCALVGSITGTFAWYGYSTRVTATMEGTAIDKAANLQIGIVGDDSITSIKGLTKEENSSIYWQELSGGLRGDAIADYLTTKGYGSDSMRPITSGNLFDGQGNRKDNIDFKGFTLYQAEEETADKADYFILPLALRVYDVANKNYAKNMKIYLSDIAVDINDENDEIDLEKAFRVDFKEERQSLEKAKHTLVAPGRESSGTTALAGLLDLNHDGFADVEGIDYEHRVRKERIYGAYDVDSAVYADTPTADYSVIPENWDFRAHLNTANHYSEKNVLVVTAFDAYEQEYLGTNDVTAKFDSSMRLKADNTASEIATTDAVDGITYLTLAVWIEGWDMDGVNENMLGVPFYLDMQFQIDRVD